MKANFLKIAKVKSEKDFYKKYPTEEAFFKAHPEARKMQHGGAATANQFFDYGMQAAGPLAAPETWYQDGGQYGGQTQLGGEPEEVDYSFINDFANMLYPDPKEELAESEDEEATEDESTEDNSMDQYAYGGGLNKFISGGEDVIYPPGFDPITGRHQLQQGQQALTRDQLMDYFKLSKGMDAHTEYMNPEGDYTHYKPIPYVAPVQQNVQRAARPVRPVAPSIKQNFFERIGDSLTAPRSRYNIGKKGVGQKKYINPSRFAEEGGTFQTGGSKSAFNYGQFPALKSGGIQGGDINAAGANITNNFVAGIRKYVADNELEQLNNEPPMDEASMGQYAQYGAQSGYGANYNPNLYNQEAWQLAAEQGKGKVQAGFNQLQDVMGQNADYVNQQNEAKQKAKQQKAYTDALQKYISGEMAKGVAKPTGDVVSQPANAGQKTIDLAPNTNNIWGTPPSFQPGGESFKRDSTINYNHHYDSPLNRFHNNAAAGDSEGSVAGWYAAEKDLKKKNPMQLSNASVAKLGLQGVIPSGTTDIDRKRILSINPKAVNQGEDGTWTPGSYGVTQDAIMNRGFFEYKNGGALKKYQAAGATGDDPNVWLADLEKQINTERENLKAFKYDQEKAEKIQAAIDKLQEVKQKIKTNMSYEEGYGIKPRDQEGLFDAFDEEEGTPVSPNLGFGSVNKAQAESKAFLAKHKKELNDAYSEYLTAAGIKEPAKVAKTTPTVTTPKAPTVPFTPYTSQEEYESHLLDKWSPEKAAAAADWKKNPSYKKVVAPTATTGQAKSSGTGYKSPTANAADQATIIPTTGGGVSYDGSTKKTSTPATTDKIDLDSIAKQLGITTDELKKRLSIIQGMSQSNTGQKVPYRYRHRGYGNLLSDSGNIPTAADVERMMTTGKENGYNVTAEFKKGMFGRRKIILRSVFNPNTGQIEQHPYSTPDSPETTGDPITGTMDQGVGPYGPDTEQTYKNLHPPAPAVRGVVENQMNPQGQDMRAWLQQNIGTTATPARPENAIPYADPDQESPNVVSPFAYGGGLNRFLPKHQNVGQTGMENYDEFGNVIPTSGMMDDNSGNMTGTINVKKPNTNKNQTYDWGQADGYTIPQSATVNGTPNTMGKKGNEKAVVKWNEGRGMNPYTSDYLLAAGNIAEGILGAPDMRAYEDKLKKMRTADYTQVASGKDLGDYGPTGQQYGAFRMNQTTPTFDSGYIPGMAGQAPIVKHGGSMSPYSYPSTLPVLPRTGMPSGDMSMYTHWNQRPVMAYGGDSNGPLGYFNKGGMPCMDCGGYMEQGGEYEQDGVYDLSQDEINQIMANGGQIEFID